MLKITFLLLAFCFTAMLSLAFFSSDFMIIAHVLLLVTIGTVLFVLLNRFVSPFSLPASNLYSRQDEYFELFLLLYQSLQVSGRNWSGTS